MTGQSRKHSAIEAVANVAIGYVVALAAQIVIFAWFGIEASIGQDVLIGLAFTVVSVVRSYLLRRLFNLIHLRKASAYTVRTEPPLTAPEPRLTKEVWGATH